MREEARRFFIENFDRLLSAVIKEIEGMSQKSKTIKETADQTGLNTAYYEGVIHGAYKTLKLIEEKCRLPDPRDSD